VIILRFLNILITNYFTFWIIGFSISTYLYPDPFRKLIYLITPALGVIMFGMGITLGGQDFKRVLLGLWQGSLLRCSASGIIYLVPHLHGGGAGKKKRFRKLVSKDINDNIENK
jgi:predicted Na+-dependent transporter